MIDITGFTFDGVNMSLAGDEVASMNQGHDTIETTKENMNELCIQWLALYNPSVLVEGD